MNRIPEELLIVTPNTPKKILQPDQAVHILLTASVKPTSFVSNSYSPTATVKVAARRPHQNNARVLGSRFDGM